jgi:hypothetical protein
MNTRTKLLEVIVGMNTTMRLLVGHPIGVVVLKGWVKVINRVGVVLLVQQVAPKNDLKKMSGVLLSALIGIGMFQVAE